MTLRILMISIALVALTLFGLITASRLSRQAKVYQAQASMWRQSEAGQRSHLTFCQKEVESTILAAGRLREKGRSIYRAEELTKENASIGIWWQANATHTEKMIAYCAMLRRKYEHASQYPWLAVAPDPPMPYWSSETGPPPEELPAPSVPR